MTDGRPPGTERRVRRLFVDAVLAFSVDPGPDNLIRYLAASRALEEARLARGMPPHTRPRTKGSGAAARRSRLGVTSKEKENTR
jgi:hypothetical protein